MRHAARRLDIRHFTGNKAVARNLHNRLCQRRAVVGLAGRFGGQHHVALVDRQAAVLYNKRHFLEVLVVIRELFSFQTHRVGARVGALRFRGAAEREVAFLVQIVADRHVVARNRMLIAVIRHGVIVSRNRYNHFVDRIDRQLTVVNNKRHFLEVAVRVRELVSFQTHLVGTRVGALRFRGAVEREVSRRVTYTFGGNRYIIPINGLFASVIRYGAIVSRNRHNHFVRDRRDFQLAFGRGNRIVDRLRIAVQLVGERVLALANVRLRARHLVRRAFAFNKAVAAYRHLVVRQRIAVVDLLVRSRGQRHRALADYELAVSRLRNDILFRRVNLANRVFVKRNSVCTGILSRHFRHIDAIEAKSYRFFFFDSLAGKTGNAMLVSIISRRVAVRRQLDVLIIVEIDYVFVRVSLNRDLLGISRYRRVAIDRNGGFRHGTTERRSSFFRRCNFSRCSVQIIVYRVIGGVLFIVERQLALVFFEIDGLLFRVTIYKIERIEIFLPGIRRCDLFGGLPHKACHFIRMDQFFSIIIDIFDRINGRKLFNINRSVHVPCIRSRRHIIIRAIVNIEFRPCNFV